ncbi:iron-sulfur cluster biosynthesis family protein [Lacticaseibacillus daqingensis]|uniref:iron-sulfur cluster biosynthesis family protein n=1 Tax=Lacticaseibacillus daqingensis TaxID=2486014 RepID=UPI000F76F9A1|nr:iron-sulfur cluster biosynthesis family protein [Lacticaseibacillus daqingensis]
MAEIQLSDALVARLRERGLADRELLLITDDGGGKYSLQGGACSIGTKFTLIVLDAPDPDYPVTLRNDAGLHLHTSDYDLIFLGPGLAMDYANGAISLKDNAHALDASVRIATGQEVLAAFERGILLEGATC